MHRGERRVQPAARVLHKVAEHGLHAVRRAARAQRQKARERALLPQQLRLPARLEWAEVLVRRQHRDVLAHAVDGLRILLAAGQLLQCTLALLLTPLVAEAALGEQPRADGRLKAVQLRRDLLEQRLVLSSRGAEARELIDRCLEGQHLCATAGTCGQHGGEQPAASRRHCRWHPRSAV